MTWLTIVFLVAVYLGPMLGAALGAATGGTKPAGLKAAIGGGIAVALGFALLGMFNAYIFYAGPVLGAVASFLIARWLR